MNNETTKQENKEDFGPGNPRFDAIAKLYIESLMEELRYPSPDLKQVPFLINIDLNDPSKSVTILGEENIRKYQEEREVKEKVEVK